MTAGRVGPTTPAGIHRLVEERFNAGDVDGLVALYEPDAVMVAADGSLSAGVAAIAHRWETKIALAGRMQLSTTYAVELGELALLRTDWTFTNGAERRQAATAEIARRQPDGRWLYVIDHPYGSDAEPRVTERISRDSR